MNQNYKSKAPLSGIHTGLFVFLSLFLVFFTYQVGGGILTFLFLGKDLFTDAGNVELKRIIISFSQFAFILFPVLILNMLRGDDFKRTFRLYKPNFIILFLGIVGIVVVQPFIQAFVFFQNEIIFSLPLGKDLLNTIKELLDALEKATLELVISNNLREFIVVVFVLAITPAICEEFLFRGLVLGNMERITSPKTVIIFTGFVFALFHLHPFNLIPLIILGVFITYVTYFSNSIISGVVLHFLNNLISAFAVFIFGKEDFTNPDISGMEYWQLGISGFISLVFFIATVYWIYHIGVKFNEKYKLI